MKRHIQAIPVNLLKLDQENVRFGGDIAQNQRESIELLLADPDDAKKLLKLADHIAEHGLDPTELQLVFPDGEGNYIVIEGNRRLTALKLLQNPDICSDSKYIKGFTAAKNKLNGSFPAEVECSVVPTRSAGEMWIELKHTGENGGIGRVNWDSNIRDERRARQTGVESIGRQIRNLIKNNPDIFHTNTVRDVTEIPVTTLTRLFSSKPAQDAFQIKIENRAIIPMQVLEYIAPSISFAIELFTNEGYNVNDIRNDDDRRRFISHIPPELNPIKLAAELDIKTSGSAYPNVKTNSTSIDQHNDTPTKVNQNSTSSKQNTSSNGSKAKAQPSSRARKYLVPWSLKILNSRINEIYRDLRSTLVVDECPNAAAIVFRVFLEVTCDDFCEQQRKANTPIKRSDKNHLLTDQDSLAKKVSAVTQHLRDQRKITEGQSRALRKRANTLDIVGSIDHFNMFVHSDASSPISSELKDIALEYRPLLEAIWQ